VYVENLDEAFHSIVQFRVPGSGDPWGEAYLVEVSRGCPHMCRFCMPAFFSTPVRHRSLQRIRELIDKGVEANRVRRVAFYALSFFDHPYADAVLEYVAGRGLEASIGSLRGDQLDEYRVSLIKRLGQRLVTIAPETFSEKLCSIIGKCISPEKAGEVAQTAWENGMHVKLYLLLGLPGETHEDVRVTASAVSGIARRQPFPGSLRLSINPLVPKPWTPFQFSKFIDEDEYYSRISIIRSMVAPQAVRIDYLSYRYALAEAIIARAYEGLVDVVVEWGVSGGKIGDLFKALRRRHISLRELIYFRRDKAEWIDLVKPGFSFKALEASWRNSLKDSSG